jgi:hypothetical protein
MINKHPVEFSNDTNGEPSPYLTTLALRRCRACRFAGGVLQAL